MPSSILKALLTISVLILVTACGNGSFKVSDINPAQQSQEPKSTLIVGATRGTGLELAKQLVARGDKVSVFVRPTSDLSNLKPLAVNFITGDAMNKADLDAAMKSGPYDAIVTTLSCRRCDTPPDYIGNKNVFDAAIESNNNRVILVSTIGVGESDAGIPWIAKYFLRNVIPLKQQAEDALTSSGLQYTIFRPGALKDAQATGKGIATEDPTVIGVITRADLATLIINSIDNTNTIGKVYSALDQEMVWPWGMMN